MKLYLWGPENLKKTFVFLNKKCQNITKIKEIFCKKMKFKIRLAAGIGIVSAKIRQEGPFSVLEWPRKIYDLISKIHEKKLKKHTLPKKRAFLGGRLLARVHNVSWAVIYIIKDTLR